MLTAAELRSAVRALGVLDAGESLYVWREGDGSTGALHTPERSRAMLASEWGSCELASWHAPRDDATVTP
jgi:hypothetical protein